MDGDLYQLYLDIYSDEILEANRGEKHRNLTPKERQTERDSRNPSLSSRTWKHSQERGISPKRRRADIEREYTYTKNEWERKNPGKSYDNRFDDDDDDYDYDNRSSDKFENIPRMPGPKPGRRKPLGSNNIRKLQPILNFSRSRRRRKKELEDELQARRAAERAKRDQKSHDHWKTHQSIEDMKSRLKAPKNKIVKFTREDYEYILNYLLDERYAVDVSSAGRIIESMSDRWADYILQSIV